jgi:ATP-dependent DNA helicase UvrD/PcrA
VPGSDLPRDEAARTARAQAILAPLDEAQRRAVLSHGPTLVVGGAGTGKTRLLAHRLAWLCAGEHVPPRRILCFTRSEREAEELRARAQRLLVFPLHGAWLGTFQDVCQRILRAHAHAVGRSGSFVILDEPDARTLVRRAARDEGADPDRWPAGRLQEVIAAHKVARTIPEGITAKVYRAYEQALADANAFDADDVLRHVLVLLDEDTALRAKYRRRFEHLVVDGWQDIAAPQRALVARLAGGDPPGNLLASGDVAPDSFLEDFPGGRVVELGHNYRSTRRILHAAQRLLERGGALRVPAKDTRRRGARVVAALTADEMEEAQLVVAWLLRIRGREGVPLHRIAVLYRHPIQARPFEEALVKSGVPYQVVGGLRFYERREIKDVLAYLRLTLGGGDPQALARIANVPRRGIGPASVRTMARLVRAGHGDHKTTLAEAALRAASLPRVTAQRAGALADLGRLLQDLDEAARGRTCVELIDYVVERSGYGRYLSEMSRAEEETRRQGIDELRGLARTFLGPAVEALAQFFERVALVSGALWVARGPDEAGSSFEPPRGEEGVQLLTYAEAPGREYDVVFLTGLEEGLLPAEGAEEAAVESDRRLVYQGMTRARNRLILTHTLSRTLFGLVRCGEPSRFLRDAGRRVRHYRMGGARRRREEGEIAGVMAVREGQRVVHPRYGPGNVVHLEDGQKTVTVRFDEAGEKRLALQYARLQPA